MRAAQLRKKHLVALVGALVRAVRDHEFEKFQGEQFAIVIPTDQFDAGVDRRFQTFVSHYEQGKERKTAITISPDGVAVRKRK